MNLENMRFPCLICSLASCRNYLCFPKYLHVSFFKCIRLFDTKVLIYFYFFKKMTGKKDYIETVFFLSFSNILMVYIV
jgi:hypothetical protein